ncbi:hypothetical protein ACF0H5_004753 [Mactra antiquata]
MVLSSLLKLFGVKIVTVLGSPHLYNLILVSVRQQPNMLKRMPNQKISTVLGWIEPERAGAVLAHEHLTCNATALMVPGPAVEFPELGIEPVRTDIGWWVTHNPYSSYDNVKLYEEHQAVLDELKFFKKNGGGTIVENTTNGIAPNPKMLANMSLNTGVNIVAGTGFYVASSRPETHGFSEENFANSMFKEITEGFGKSDIKAGVIGEIGCTWPLQDTEKTVLRATAQVECDTGCPVIIHPGRNPQAPFDIIRIYQEAGGHVDRVVMSHIDRTLHDTSELLEFAELGCYVEYDLFGLETSYYQLWKEVDMPSDGVRIQRIKELVDNGFEDKITVSHDIHTKHRLMKYGGHGYSHILLHVVPKMLERGLTQAQIDKILKMNPQTWLTFSK